MAEKPPGIFKRAINRMIGSFFYVSDPNQARLVMFMGKPARTITTPGWHFKIPFLERLEPAAIFLGARTVTIQLEKTKTKDGLYPTIPVKMHFRVTDPSTFYWLGHENAQKQLSEIIENELKQHVSGQTIDELFQSQSTLNALLKNTLAPQDISQSPTRHLGMIVDKVFIEDIDPTDEFRKASNARRAADLEKETIRIQAEAKAAEKLIMAKAEGEALALQRDMALKGLSHTYSDLVGEGMDKLEAREFILATVDTETLRKLGEKGNMVLAFDKKRGGTSKRDLVQTATLKKLTDQDKKDEKPSDPPKPQ